MVLEFKACQLRIIAVACFFMLLPQRVSALRVVSLMPSYTEIIFAVGAGDDLVGVSNFCDYPPAAALKTKVGDYFSPNPEKIYSLKPDLVFASGSSCLSVGKQLSTFGIRTVCVPAESRVADIFSTIRVIARETGRKSEGEKLISTLKKSVPRRRAKYVPRRVYIDVDSGLWTCGGDSYISDAVRMAGGENVFSAERRQYFQASWERVLKENPDYILSVSGASGQLADMPLAGSLSAVKNGRIITSIDRNIFTRPSPRLFGEIKKLSEILK